MNQYRYPDSVGRDSSQIRCPLPSTAVPPSRLEAPVTTSAVIGDFQEPYGAVILGSCCATSETSLLVLGEEDMDEDMDEAMVV